MNLLNILKNIHLNEKKYKEKFIQILAYITNKLNDFEKNK